MKVATNNSPFAHNLQWWFPAHRLTLNDISGFSICSKLYFSSRSQEGFFPLPKGLAVCSPLQKKRLCLKCEFPAVAVSACHTVLQGETSPLKTWASILPSISSSLWERTKFRQIRLIPFIVVINECQNLGSQTKCTAGSETNSRANESIFSTVENQA